MSFDFFFSDASCVFRAHVWIVARNVHTFRLLEDWFRPGEKKKEREKTHAKIHCPLNDRVKYANSQRHGTVLSHGGQMTTMRICLFSWIFAFIFGHLLRLHVCEKPEQATENVIHNLLIYYPNYFTLFSFFVNLFYRLDSCIHGKVFVIC